MSGAKDKVSFLDEMSDVKPLNQAKKLAPLNRSEKTLAQQLKRQSIEKSIAMDDNGLSIEYVEPIDPYDFLSYKKDGVQEGVFKKLRLGKYQIDSRLVIKHLTFEDARLTIYQNIMDCHNAGIRTLLIDHGLGLKSKPFPGFLKSYVRQWLTEIKPVIAFHTALKQHGGLGSVYVLLGKNPNEKAMNRELHKQR